MATDHALAPGDRVCHEANVRARYGVVRRVKRDAVQVAWEDGGPASWLPRQRVFYAPEADDVARLARELKPWRE